jgi:hypothetical protein
MSTLSALNNIQNKFSDSASNNSTAKEKSAGGEAFSKTLDLAMKNKASVLPAPANLALDAGLSMLGQTPKAGPASIKDSIEDIFGELSTGIAGSFAAALAGEDSATAVTPTAESIKENAAKNNIAPHPECLAHDSLDTNPLLTAANVADTKKAVDSIAPLMPDNKVMPIANSSLSTLEDLLFDNEDKKEQQKG